MTVTTSEEGGEKGSFGVRDDRVEGWRSNADVEGSIGTTTARR